MTTQTIDDAGGITSGAVRSAAAVVWMVHDTATFPAAGTDQAAYQTAMEALNAGRLGQDYVFDRYFQFDAALASPPDPFASGVALILYCPSTDASTLAGKTGLSLSVAPASGAPHATNMGRAAHATVASWLYDYYLAGGKLLGVGASAERLFASAPFGFIKNRTAVARGAGAPSSAAKGSLGYHIANQRNTRGRKATRYADGLSDTTANHRKWLDDLSNDGAEFPAGALTATQSFQIDATGNFETSTVIGYMRSRTVGTADGSNVNTYGGTAVTDVGVASFTQLRRTAACGRAYLLGGGFGRSDNTGISGTVALNTSSSWDELLTDAADHLATPIGVTSAAVFHRLTSGSDGDASQEYRSFNKGEQVTVRALADATYSNALLFLGLMGNTLDGFDNAGMVVDGTDQGASVSYVHTAVAPLGWRRLRVIAVDRSNDPAAQYGDADADEANAWAVYDYFRTSSAAGAFDDNWVTTSANPAEQGSTATLRFALDAGWHDDDWPDGPTWPDAAKHNRPSLTVTADVVAAFDEDYSLTVTGITDPNTDGVYTFNVAIPDDAVLGGYFLVVTEP